MIPEKYRQAVEEYLETFLKEQYPENLYAPVRYILEAGGKRLRPVFTLLVTEAYGMPFERSLPAAVALEVFHNFTLLHDDIMDRADKRRGKPAVHKKWNENVAILSGDVMVFLAQKELEKYPPGIFVRLQSLFNKTAIEICEGQQQDMDFEERKEVLPEEYLEMIRKKTAVLLGTALQYGAIVAEREKTEQELLYNMGVQIGLAFQAADDYLDVFGGKKTGKKEGGDILDRKKTALYVWALEILPLAEKEAFIRLYHDTEKDDRIKIREVKEIFKAYGIDRKVLQLIRFHSDEALQYLKKTRMKEDVKWIFRNLIENLSRREW
jgi:geranylgeranyl diphosphate synthase type II